MLVGVLRHQMHRQIFLIEIMLVAVLAAIEILVGVRIPMLQILSPVVETLVARLALETIVTRVPPTMTLQIGLLIGAVFAELAGEYLRSCMYQFVAGNVHGAAKRLVALVATEGAIDVVQVLQVFHELASVTETGPAFNALMDGARFASSLPEMRENHEICISRWDHVGISYDIFALNNQCCIYNMLVYAYKSWMIHF